MKRNRRVRATLGFGVCVVMGLAAWLAPLLPLHALAEDDAGWELTTTHGTIEIYNRVRPQARVKELKATGIIDAPPWVCKNVVDDIGRFDEFMPYTAESTVVAREAEGVVHYERVVAPFVSDRDYTLLSTDRSTRLPDGTVVYKRAWTTANDRGPEAERGVVRIEVVEGFWQFEPIDEGRRSRATYYVYTDPGGRLPAFVVEAANRRAIPGLFEAVESQAQAQRYRRTRPEIRGAPRSP